MAIREKERQIRVQRGMESLKMPEKQFKLKQFDNVKSRALEPFKAQRKVLPLDPAGSTGAVKRSASTPPPPIQTDNPLDADAMSVAAFEAEVERIKAMHAHKNRKVNIAKNTNGCPKYLQKIKANLAEEQREADEKRRGPTIPEGYRLMPKDEVDETLA